MRSQVHRKVATRLPFKRALCALRRVKMIEWTGNLNDDCKADWEGIHLHAEQMDKNYWWWGIYDSNHKQLDSSNEYEERFKNGKTARSAAEEAVRKYAST